MFPLKYLLPSLLLLAICGSASSDELWNRAMFHTDPERSEQASTMRMESFEFSRDGSKSGETRYLYTWNPSANDFILQTATKDGKDVTEQERRRQERRDSDESPYPHQIFNPEKGVGLTLKPRPAASSLYGRVCRVYDFVFKDSWPIGPGKPRPVTEEGFVYVDVESGMPLWMESRLIEGPDMIDSYEYRMSGSPGKDGGWRLLELTMEFAGNLIITRGGGFRMRFEYGDF